VEELFDERAMNGERCRRLGTAKKMGKEEWTKKNPRRFSARAFFT
jgi:hypothetical protein